MCVPIIHNIPQIVYTYHFEGSFCWSSIPFWLPKPYPKFGGMESQNIPQIWGIFWDSRPQIWGMFWDSIPHTPKFGVWFRRSKRYRRPTKTSVKVVRINNLWHIVYNWNTHLGYILNKIWGIFWTRFGVYFEQDLGYIITIIGVYYNKNWGIHTPNIGV